MFFPDCLFIIAMSIYIGVLVIQEVHGNINVIDMGPESIGFAAVSSLYCPRDDELACLDVNRYNQFKMVHTEPENYALVWALGVLGQHPCINLIEEEECPTNTTAFGILTNCQLCVDNGYGWCREAYNTDEDGIIHENVPPLAPLCIDSYNINHCPYNGEEPVHVCL